MDDSAIAELGGFALSEVLSSLDPSLSEFTSSLSSFGLSSASAAGFSRDAIYNAKFMDDDDDQDGDDLEDQVDKEMYDEKFSKSSGPGGSKKAGLVRGEEDDFDDDDDDEEGEEEKPIIPLDSAVEEEEEEQDAPTQSSAELAQQRKEERMLARINKRGLKDATANATNTTAVVKELFPAFEKGKTLAFTDLFGTRPRKRRRKDVGIGAKMALPPTDLPLARSTKDLLLLPLQPKPVQKISIPIEEADLFVGGEDLSARGNETMGFGDEEEVEEELELVRTIENSTRNLDSKWIIPPLGSSQPGFSLAELDSWESRIIWDPLPISTPRNTEVILAPRNNQFDSGIWLKSIIWDQGTKYREWWKPELNLNDKGMLLEVVSEADQHPGSAFDDKNNNSSKPPLQIKSSAMHHDELNLSNDKEYEVTRDAKRRIRQTFGLLEVVHAYPAQKLQLPFYKTRLTKSDARSFHRPPIQFPANVQLSFTKAKSAKKKKDPKSGRRIRKAEGAEGIRTMGDLSARDLGGFLLWEYSEENPPIISNVGMGSLLVNYYRKKDATDGFVPQLEIGQPLLLDSTDESPFKAFGSVEPGQTVPTLYNNLVRAPLFKHKPSDGDFLLVRTTIDGETKYYIREIKHVYVVGQTYPLTEVPGPHSRKISTLSKNRLQTIAFKLVNKNPKSRIKVNQLTRYFQDQNDLQMRQRLKEFMEFNRKGTDQGFWMIKPSVRIPDDAEMLKLATPEMVCLSESMQVGLRHLQDAGYGKAEEGGAGDDDSKLDIEQQLAPWITTKNFINATANKAMLKLHGEGDPTGRGEAFSFLRVSMKDIFLRAGEEMSTRLAQMEARPKSAHRYNVQEQQDVYKEEIARIWKAQFDALSNPVEPYLTQEDEDRSRGRTTTGGVPETPGSYAGTPWGTRPGTPGSRASSPDKDDGMSVASGGVGGRQAYGQQKILRVRRLIKGVWETEIVRDPSVIAAYIRQRQTIEDERTDADDLLPSDDEGKNERRKKRLREQLEKLKKNQERRLARKNQKMGVPTGAIGAGGKKNAKPETTRICGNCGQRGHMKTSKRLCPRWHEFNGPKDLQPSTAQPTAFGGGLALPTLGGTPQASASSSPAPPKSVLKLKLSGQMSPPQEPSSGPAL